MVDILPCFFLDIAQNLGHGIVFCDPPLDNRRSLCPFHRVPLSLRSYPFGFGFGFGVGFGFGFGVGVGIGIRFGVRFEIGFEFGFGFEVEFGFCFREALKIKFKMVMTSR